MFIQYSGPGRAIVRFYAIHKKCFNSHDIPLPNHFSKAGSSWEGGIANVYHDPCQDWMDLINMKLTSPNYPEPYDPLEYCKWTITAPPGHLVTLNFETINVSNMSSKI